MSMIGMYVYISLFGPEPCFCLYYSLSLLFVQSVSVFHLQTCMSMIGMYVYISLFGPEPFFCLYYALSLRVSLLFIYRLVCVWCVCMCIQVSLGPSLSRVFIIYYYIFNFIEELAAVASACANLDECSTSPPFYHNISAPLFLGWAPLPREQFFFPSIRPLCIASDLSAVLVWTIREGTKTPQVCQRTRIPHGKKLTDAKLE